jgi:hypothetical protein
MTIEQGDDDGQVHELRRSATCEPLRLLSPLWKSLAGVTGVSWAPTATAATRVEALSEK